MREPSWRQSPTRLSRVGDIARIDRARELLERTDLSGTQIAERAGLGYDANPRRHFGHIIGTSPTAYRRTFRDEPSCVGFGLVPEGLGSRRPSQ